LIPAVDGTPDYKMPLKPVFINTSLNTIYLTIGDSKECTISTPDLYSKGIDLKELRKGDGPVDLDITLQNIYDDALTYLTSRIIKTEGFSDNLRHLSIRLENSGRDSDYAFKTAEGLSYLFENIEKLPNLETLEIENIQITNTQLRDMAEALAKDSSIKEIKFDNCLIQSSGAKVLTKGLTRNNSVERIILDGNPGIGDEGTVAIANALKTSQINEVFLRGMSANIKADKEYYDSLYNGYNLGNRIGNRGFKAFVDALCESERPISFDLSDNNIDDKGMNYLAGKIESFDTIVHKKPQIDDKDKENKGEELSQQTLKPEEGETQDNAEESLYEFMEKAVYRGKPAEIILKDNIITDEGASRVLEAINTNPFMMRPDLSENQIQDEQILVDIGEKLEKHNSPSLTEGEFMSQVVLSLSGLDQNSVVEEVLERLLDPIEGPLSYMKTSNEMKSEEDRLSEKELQKKMEERRNELREGLAKNKATRLGMKRSLTKRSNAVPASCIRTSFSQNVPGNSTQADTDPLAIEMEKLNSMIGLENVKKKITRMTNLYRVMGLREERGLKTSTTTAHMVFSGNPGTGKTTVARRLGKILKAIGRLEKGHVIEVKRADIVGGFLGQTEAKSKAKIKEALGGILFIDEAYTLTPESVHADIDYGTVAIETILTEMEDYRDELVVIAAGYKDEMKKFINANPGLKSRFKNEIEFDDYSGEELVQIFQLFASEAVFKLTDEAEGLLRKECNKILLPENKPDNFANGRFARNIFEETIEHQSGRVLDEGKTDTESLMSISIADITFPENGFEQG